MGIEKGGNFLYLNVSCGELVNKKKDIHCKAYSGYIIGIDRKEDTYEGKSVNKITLSMKDHSSDEVAKISWTEESYFSIGFFSQILGVDLSKPVRFGVSGSAENEKISFCWLSQFDKNVERNKDFPKPEKKKIGRNEVMDWSVPLAEFDKILDYVSKNLSNAAPPANAETSNVAAHTGSDNEDDVIGPLPGSGGLPF